jgi:hypothetical protein
MSALRAHFSCVARNAGYGLPHLFSAGCRKLELASAPCRKGNCILLVIIGRSFLAHKNQKQKRFRIANDRTALRPINSHHPARSHRHLEFHTAHRAACGSAALVQNHRSMLPRRLCSARSRRMGLHLQRARPSDRRLYVLAFRSRIALRSKRIANGRIKTG